MDKQNRRPSRKIGLGGILLRAALILLCLVLLTVHLMGSLYARYISRGEGSDNARVAEFDVDVAFDDGGELQKSVTATMAYNTETQTYEIVVTNRSEVAISYDIYVRNITVDNGSGEGITLKLDDGATKAFDSEVVFMDAGAMAPGNASKSHNLNFMVDWSEFLENFTGESVSVTITFDILVDVKQVD